MDLYDRLSDAPWATSLPRTLTPELEKHFRGMIFRPPGWMFWTDGPAGWEKKMSEAPLRFACIVQANNRLYDAETAAYLPAVFLATEDERGADWRFVAEQGGALKAALDRGDCPELSAHLAAETESFDVRVDPSLTGGVSFRMWDQFIDPDRLPGGAVPEVRVIPSLLVEGEGFSMLPVAAYA